MPPVTGLPAVQVLYSNASMAWCSSITFELGIGLRNGIFVARSSSASAAQLLRPRRALCVAFAKVLPVTHYCTLVGEMEVKFKGLSRYTLHHQISLTLYIPTQSHTARHVFLV